MKYFVYILKSEVNGKTYTGYTSDLEQRIKEHNSGKTKSIKPYIPYKLIYSEILNSKEEAIKREKYLKSGIGREFIKSILQS
ncbi:MAG: GIY-YIG nuclease family protein [Cyclobacteriaceae bacterium]|nr:GIY-YIG nuclease family protein [Cyclobacteriaceae bacterium]